MNSIRNLVAVAVAALATILCFHSASAYAINEPVLNQGTRNHYMVLANSPTMFALAAQIAAAAGGHLVTVDSRSEQQWVLSTFPNVRMFTSTGSIIGTGTMRVVVEFDHLDVVQIAVNPVTNHQYRLLAMSSGVQADAEARLAGGHLVSLDSAGEGQWVLDTFSAGSTRAIWISTTRIIGGTPSPGPIAYGLVEFDDAPAGAGLVAGSTTLGATDGANLFANVGAQPVAQDAPTATHKASWGELKARYR